MQNFITLVQPLMGEVSSPRKYTIVGVKGGGEVSDFLKRGNLILLVTEGRMQNFQPLPPTLLGEFG